MTRQWATNDQSPSNVAVVEDNMFLFQQYPIELHNYGVNEFSMQISGASLAHFCLNIVPALVPNSETNQNTSVWRQYDKAGAIWLFVASLPEA